MVILLSQSLQQKGSPRASYVFEESLRTMPLRATQRRTSQPPVLQTDRSRERARKKRRKRKPAAKWTKAAKREREGALLA
ncbi:hypothetical protein Y1Q_0000769 [Alligator mississippiensis]|uniref:Uncharacterized protein n=1 Tax=Alligator mississippiensis TaxID=8496 RepID=A0A151MCE1_ALLMI|nr:hypothetical protein Y1Q_0000769 [Alligator mississippiensis]